MKYYTSTIPFPLAEKLKEKGMPMEIWNGTVQGMPYIVIMEKSSFDWLDKELGNTPSEVEVRYSIPTFGACFDWLLSEKNLHVWFLPTWDSPSDSHLNYEYRITRMTVPFKEHTDDVSYSWHEAAEKAIEKALTLI